MLFDAMCRVLERHMPPDDRRTKEAKRAALFDLRDHNWNEIVYTLDGSDVIQIAAEFFLPFPVIAIETGNHCALMSRHTYEPDVRGIGSVPDGALFVHFASRPAPGQLERMLGVTDPEAVIMISGAISHWIPHPETGPSGMEARCAVASITIASRKRVYAYRDTLKPDGQKAVKELGITEEVVSNVKALVRFLYWACQPHRWIVTRESIAERQPKAGTIPRGHQRPRYIVIEREEVERIFRVDSSEPGRHLEAGHRRRAHWRVLRAERWGEAKGRRVFVKACWVGPTEAVVGGERYRVCLEAESYAPASTPSPTPASPDTSAP